MYYIDMKLMEYAADFSLLKNSGESSVSAFYIFKGLCCLWYDFFHSAEKDKMLSTQW